MCQEHARGRLRDLMLTQGFPKPLSSEDEADTLGRQTRRLTNGFLAEVSNVISLKECNGRVEAHKFLYRFLDAVKEANGGSFPTGNDKSQLMLEKHFKNLRAKVESESIAAEVSKSTLHMNA